VEQRNKETKKLNDLFIQRWSPRSFAEEPVKEEDLYAILEAGRWAPSSSNEQPWQIVIATSDGARKKIIDSMVEFNKLWAPKAPILLAFAYRKNFTDSGKPNPTAAFDTGAAWMSMALQASMLGYITHGMAGFDSEKAAAACDLDSNWEVIALCALGKKGPIEALPERMRKSELPNSRKPLQQIIKLLR